MTKLNALLAPVFLSLSLCFVSSVNAEEGLTACYSSVSAPKPIISEISQTPRIAFVYSKKRDYHAHAYDEIFASLKYSFDRWENINADKLVESLSNYDILLFHENCQLANPQDFNKYKKEWLSFLERGGVIIVQDVQEMSFDWIASLGPSFSLSVESFPAFQESNDWANPFAELNFGPVIATWAHFKNWSPDWIVSSKNGHDMPIILYQRVGKGLIVVTTSYFSSGFPREKHLEAIWNLILKEREKPPVKVDSVSWGNKYFGENEFKIKMENKGEVSLGLMPVLTLCRNGEKVFVSGDKLYHIPVQESREIVLPYHIALKGFYAIKVALFDSLKEKTYFYITGEVEIENLEGLISKWKEKIKEKKETFLIISKCLEENFSLQLKEFKKTASSADKFTWRNQLNHIKNAIRGLETLGENPNIIKLAETWKNLGVMPDGCTQFVVSQATSLEKVFRDKVWNKPVAHEIKLQMAANEYESAQLVIVPLVNELHNVKATCTDLISKKTGKKINADNVDIWPVGYLFFKNSRQFWPDPLLHKETFDLNSRDQVVQPVWITVYAPEGTPPGNYTGDITVTSSNHSTNVMLVVMVRDFALPREQHFKTGYNVRPNQISRFYNSTQDYRHVLPVEEYRKYLEILLKYRITPALYDESWPHESLPLPPSYEFRPTLAYTGETHNPDGSCSFDFSIAGENLKYCWDRGATLTPIGFVSTSDTPKYNELLTQYLKDATRFLKEKGWLNAVYLYAPDERQPEEFKRLNELIGLARKISPDLKMFMAASDSSKALIKEGIADKMDIWCPYITFLGLEENVRMKKNGKEIWCYANHAFNIPLPAINHRIIFWIGWKYNLDGFHYWGTVWWEGHNLNNVDAAGPKETWDPYPTFGDQKGAPGDGYLFYPSLAGNPVHSIRLEITRDGLEDWEYLYILKGRVEELKKKKPEGYEVLVEEAEKLLEIDDDIVKDANFYTKNPEKIYERREKVAHQIEKINQILRKS